MFFVLAINYESTRRKCKRTTFFLTFLQNPTVAVVTMNTADMREIHTRKFAR